MNSVISSLSSSYTQHSKLPFNESFMTLITVFLSPVAEQKGGIGNTLSLYVCACCEHDKVKNKWSTFLHFGVWLHLGIRRCNDLREPILLQDKTPQSKDQTIMYK